jgi:hypothetical protein
VHLGTPQPESEIHCHFTLTDPTGDHSWATVGVQRLEGSIHTEMLGGSLNRHSTKMAVPKQAVSLSGLTPFLGRVSLKHLFTKQHRDPENPRCSLTRVKIVTHVHGSLFYMIQGVNVFDWTFQDDVMFTLETVCVVPGKVVPLNEALKMQEIKSVPPETAVIRMTQFFSSNCLKCGKPGAKRRCSACQESKPGSPCYYYCDNACQKAHWPIHKVVCPKN